MPEKLPVKDFKWIEDLSKIDENFIKNYDEDKNIRYFLKVDIQYLKELRDLHSDFSFLPERMKLNKCKKLVYNLYNKKKLYCSHTSFKTSIKVWFKSKKGS